MGWPKFSLSSLCTEFTDGNWVESKDQSPKGVRLIQTGNVGEGQFKSRADKARFISESTFSKLKCFEIFEGDCLISRLPDPVGRSCVLPNTGERMITAVDCTVVRFDAEKLLPSYFNYYSQSKAYLSEVDHLTSGATRKRISRKNLGKVEIPTPPVAEQKRIITILDQAFADIDKARGLTKQNLKNARELFESTLQQVFSQRGASSSTGTCQPYANHNSTMAKNVPAEETFGTTKTGGRAATNRVIPGNWSLSVGMPEILPKPNWRWSKLSELARLESGHTPSRKRPEYWGGDIPWIGIKDARNTSGTTIKHTLQNTNQLGIDNSSARVLPAGTVCLSRTASVGYVIVMGVQMATSQDFVNWVCTEELVPDFLKYLLLAEGRDFSKFSSGSVHQTIYFPEVKAFHICHPEPTEQKRLVAYLDEIALRSESLVSIYEAKLTKLDELKKSLLQKAFSGELTQDFTEAAAA